MEQALNRNIAIDQDTHPLRLSLMAILGLFIIAMILVVPAALARNKTTPQTKAKIEAVADLASSNTDDITSLKMQLAKIQSNQEALLSTINKATLRGSNQRAQILEHVQEIDKEIEELK